MNFRSLFSPTHPLQLALGLIIWSAWFVLIYSVLSIACEFATLDEALHSRNWLNGLLLILTLVTTAFLLFLAWRCWRAATPPGHKQFITRVAAGIYLVAAISTLAVGLPTLVLPPCL
jgi:hypothetical protein